MPDISKITLPSGTTYDIKDAVARQEIADIKVDLTGAMFYAGITTTAITDGSTTATLVIDDESRTFKADDAGATVIYGNLEFVWNGSKWQEFGSTGSLKALAFKDTASASYTPVGTVSKPTFTGSSSNVTITVTDNTNGNYTPAGTVSKPTFTGTSTTSTGKFTPEGSVTVTTNATTNKTTTVSATTGTATYTPEGNCTGAAVTLNTTTVNSITAVGTLPTLTTTVADENLTISFNQGTLPTKGDNTTVATSVKSVTQPTFTGTGARLVTGNIPVPNTYTATFAGTEGDISVAGTPGGSVSQPTFTGSKVQIAGTTTANGSVSQPTFTGTGATITVS